jgi:hypothetical protein
MDEEPRPNGEVLEIAVEGGRQQLSTAFDMMEDIDNTALHWVRSSLLTIGLMIPVGVFVFRPSTPRPPVASIWLSGFGIVLLFAGVVIGSFLQASTTVNTGMNAEALEAVLTTSSSKGEFLAELLARQAEWVSENDSEIARNSSLLVYQQVVVILGVVCILLALGFITAEFLPTNT